MNIKLMFTVLAAAAALTTPAFSDGGGSLDGQASYAVRIEGYVPVICRVSVDAQAAAPGERIDLGRMTEFCNSAGGYQVWVDHAPGLDGALYVDDQRIALSPGGSTLVSASATAALRTHQLALETGESQVSALSMRMVPL